MAFDNIPIDEIKTKLPNLTSIYFYGSKVYKENSIFQPLYDTKGNAVNVMDLISLPVSESLTISNNNMQGSDRRPQSANMRHKIFVSYSHKDEKYRQDVETSLRTLNYTENKLDFEWWDDKKIVPGSDWEQSIESKIEGATIGILIVSRNFLASEFIMRKEVPVLLEKMQNDGTRLLTIVAGACLFEKHFFRKYQTINPPNRPLSSLGDHEQELIYSKLENTIIGIIEGKI